MHDWRLNRGQSVGTKEREDRGKKEKKEGGIVNRQGCVGIKRCCICDRGVTKPDR